MNNNLSFLWHEDTFEINCMWQDLLFACGYIFTIYPPFSFVVPSDRPSFLYPLTICTHVLTCVQLTVWWNPNSPLSDVLRLSLLVCGSAVSISCHRYIVWTKTCCHCRGHVHMLLFLSQQSSISGRWSWSFALHVYPWKPSQTFVCVFYIDVLHTLL